MKVAEVLRYDPKLLSWEDFVMSAVERDKGFCSTEAVGKILVQNEFVAHNSIYDVTQILTYLSSSAES